MSWVWYCYFINFKIAYECIFGGKFYVTIDELKISEKLVGLARMTVSQTKMSAKIMEQGDILIKMRRRADAPSV